MTDARQYVLVASKWRRRSARLALVCKAGVVSVVEGLLSSVSILVLVLGVCEYVFSGSIIDCL